MAKEFLSRKGVAFIEKDVSRDQVAAMEMVRRSGQQGVPVITVDGEVVVGFNRLRLEQLLAAQPQNRPSLGVKVADAVRHAPPGSLPGAYVGEVKPGSPAEHAGVRRGDIVIEVGGRPVRSADELIALTTKLAPGQALPLTVMRDGQRGIVTAQL